MEFLNSIISVFVVSLISLIGILVLLKRIDAKSKIIKLMIAFAAGAIIGDAFIHLLPEYIETFEYSNELPILIFIGIIFMMIVEGVLHFKHDHNHDSTDDRRPLLARLNLFSDGMHNFLDGITIGVSYLISFEVGVATTIAIILHEIPQELADTAVLVYAGWRRKKILIANFLIALTSIIGVALVFLGDSLVENIEQFLLPIAIGQFLYISLASLIPEIHRNNNKKVYIGSILAFTLGLLLMYSLVLFE